MASQPVTLSISIVGIFSFLFMAKYFVLFVFYGLSELPFGSAKHRNKQRKKNGFDSVSPNFITQKIVKRKFNFVSYVNTGMHSGNKVSVASSDFT